MFQSKVTYRYFLSLLSCLISLAMLLVPGNYAAAAVSSNLPGDIEISVKVVCQEQATEDAKGAMLGGSYDAEDVYKFQDELTTVYEGKAKFKCSEDQAYWDCQTWPREIGYEETERNYTLSGFGGGQSHQTLHHGEARNGEVKIFTDEVNQNWTYTIKDPQFDNSLVSGVFVNQETEDSPLRYKIWLFGDEQFYCVNNFLSEENIDRSFDGMSTTSKSYPDYSVMHLRSVWDAWSNKNTGNSCELEGEFSFDGGTYSGSGEYSDKYVYTDPESGYTSTDTIQVYYQINRKPSIKEIQPNQVLGRSYYNEENDNYVPMTKFAAGKDTVVQVFLPDDIRAEEQTEGEVKVYRDGVNIAALTDFKTDSKNNALIFVPSDRGSCGNWAAGTYKFVATIGDSDEFTLDNVEFKERRKLKVLAVPVWANYGGTLELPGDEWKNGSSFMRKVYPLAWDDIEYKQHSLEPAIDPEFDLTTADWTGPRKLWEKLRDMKNSGGGPYDLVIGFIESPIGKTYGFTWGPPATVVVNSSEDMPATIAHEIAHVYDVGDEYKGGTFNLAANYPPYTFVGTDWYDRSKSVTANDPEVESYSGYGSLIKEKLFPYDTRGGKLLEDSKCFMGNALACPLDKCWISPSVYLQLYRSLTPSEEATVSLSSADLSAGSILVIEATGWISQSGQVELSLPWPTYTTAHTVDSPGGNYYVQALDQADTVLGENSFTPEFYVLSDPPRESEQAPFSVKVPFPAATKKLRIIDNNNTILKEVQVSANAPEVNVKALAPAGGEVAGHAVIVWDAADVDKDPLYYEVEYTPDGINWEMLAFGLTEKQWEQDFSLLPGGDKAQIRITASDGIRSTTALSGLFKVPLKEMEVYIDEPAGGASVSADGVTFSGSAYDPQQGEIYDDEKLVWSSDRDGLLGYGHTLFTNKLSQGKHQITLNATNAAGVSKSQNIDIIAQPSIKLSVSPSLVNLEIGQTQALTPTAIPSDATVTYTSINLAVATVDETTGLVTALADGKTTIIIKATRDGYIDGYAGATVTVGTSENEDPGSSISITGAGTDVSGNVILLMMSADLVGEQGDPAAFAIGGVASNPVPSSVMISGSTVVLILNKPIIHSDVPTISYTATGTNNLTDGTNFVTNFSNQIILNNVPGLSPLYGDVNGDGAVDGEDALEILFNEAQLYDNMSVQAKDTLQDTPQIADVNQDGIVNGFDSMDILFYEAHLYDFMSAGAKSRLDIN